MSGLFIGSWELGFARVQVLGRLLLANPMPDGCQVVGTVVQDIKNGINRIGERDVGSAVPLLRFVFIERKISVW